MKETVETDTTWSLGPSGTDGKVMMQSLTEVSG